MRNTIPDDHLLRLFLADAKAQLKAKAQAAILASVADELDSAVDGAFQSLQLRLVQFYEMETGNTVVNLVMRKVQP
ncbi:hypothetical protein [Lysobacter sp. Hz 25]|uniref:hypothetical protein n=1 Tax=Lysobacter sp. Hz 25 TaxID=3383698 RepID=UPI0038D4C8B7